MSSISYKNSHPPFYWKLDFSSHPPSISNPPSIRALRVCIIYLKEVICTFNFHKVKIKSVPWIWLGPYSPTFQKEAHGKSTQIFFGINCQMHKLYQLTNRKKTQQKQDLSIWIIFFILLNSEAMLIIS